MPDANPSHAVRRHSNAPLRTTRATPIAVLALAGCLALAACGGRTPTAAQASDTGDSAATQGEATVAAGELVVRASAVQTSRLAAASAQRYGIERDAHTVLLLVAVRRGDAADAVSVQAEVTASATDTDGKRRDIPMHAQRSDAPGQAAGLTDYIGIVGTELPGTLQFEVIAEPEGAAPLQLRFSRDFYPL